MLPQHVKICEAQYDLQLKSLAAGDKSCLDFKRGEGLQIMTWRVKSKSITCKLLWNIITLEGSAGTALTAKTWREGREDRWQLLTLKP